MYLQVVVIVIAAVGVVDIQGYVLSVASTTILTTIITDLPTMSNPGVKLKR